MLPPILLCLVDVVRRNDDDAYSRVSKAAPIVSHPTQMLSRIWSRKPAQKDEEHRPLGSQLLEAHSAPVHVTSGLSLLVSQLRSRITLFKHLYTSLERVCLLDTTAPPGHLLVDIRSLSVPPHPDGSGPTTYEFAWR